MTLIKNYISNSPHEIRIIKGTPISKGIAEGRVFVKKIDMTNCHKKFFKNHGSKQEVANYMNALEQLTVEFETLKNKGLKDQAAQQMIDLCCVLIRDDFYTKRIPEYIFEQNIPAQTAILKQLSLLKIDFDKLDNEYFRSRFEDFNSLGRHLLDIINGDFSFDKFKHPAIFIAEEISPAEIIRFASQKKLLAILSIKGGITSHAAILADSYGIPTIFGIDKLLSVKSGQRVIVDAYKGEVIIDPDATTLITYRDLKTQREAYEKKLIQLVNQKPQMKSGEHLEIFANVGTVQDINGAKKAHADGIGLFRTEVFTLADKSPLEEEKLFKEYSILLSDTDKHPVTIRTLDLGGDKFSECTGENPLGEANPFLGYRSTRMFIDDPKDLKIQLRALLRASVKNPHIKIMFPFITTLEDFLNLKMIYQGIIQELEKELPHIINIPLGMMAEIPSVILCIEDFIPHIDFLSIGTNDLTQYTLAVDRNNPYVSKYYQDAHPAVLKLIKKASDACHIANIPLSICGEMAKEAYFTRFLLGLGIRTFSLTSSFIPLVKFIAINSTQEECKTLAESALLLKNSQEIQKLLENDLNIFLTKNKGSFQCQNFR